MLIEHLEKIYSESPPSRSRRLSASNIGRCVLANWASYRGIEPTDPEFGFKSRMALQLGTKIEEIFGEFLQSSGMKIIPGIGNLGRIEELGISCVADFFCELDRDVDLNALGENSAIESKTLSRFFDLKPPRAGEGVVIEIKSMSNYAFSNLKRGHIDERYWHQCQAYMHAFGTRWCIFIGIAKESSEVRELWIAKDSGWLDEARKIVAIVQSEERPKRPYEPKLSKFRAIPPPGIHIPTFPCGYCEYRTWCWGRLEKITIDSKTYFVPLDDVFHKRLWFGS